MSRLAVLRMLLARLFFSRVFSTLTVLAFVLFLVAAVDGGVLAGELPPPTSSVSGPGDVTGPQPIPSGVQDLSFLPTIDKDGLGPAKTPEQLASVLQVVGLVTFIGFIPGILLMMTAFTRIMIVLSFLRRALGTQTMPADQIMVGLAMFLTLFVMAPTWEKAWDNGLKPYLEQQRDPETGLEMTQREMFERVLAPQREFMISCLMANEGESELRFFMGVSGHHVKEKDGTRYWIGENNRKVQQFSELQGRDIPTVVLIPAYICSELKRSFWMGFLLYLPFLILDMVIASVLMSMGMMMLPPVMISLPFKIVMFILIDGWRLLLEALVTSFPPEMLKFIDTIV